MSPVAEQSAPDRATSGSLATISICHLSDLHLPSPVALRLRDLMSKRLLGAANVRFRRAATHQLRPLEALLGQVQSEDADLVLVTGDLGNLSLPAEFLAVEDLLRRHGLSPGQTVVLPGNHDRYTRQADRGHAFEAVFGEWRPPGAGSSGWPAVGFAGPIALIALDTAMWRGPLRAAGRIGRRQLEELQKALDMARERDLHPVVALHHPPLPLAGWAFKQYRDGLQDYRRLLAVLSGYRCTLVHGHSHVLARTQLHDIEIVGVPSASNNVGIPARQAAFNRYTFSARGIEAVESVRWWPGSASDDERFERVIIA